ncbi:hypothetical protein EPO15_17955 [bacterium]|nr:MAG: hypothetical protein EPO15_17955 [bacterium]
MKALTLRHLKPELAREIERKARETGQSLSGAVLALLEQAMGLTKPRRQRHDDLDRFSGAWSADEARAFDEALAGQRRIDPELWG